VSLDLSLIPIEYEDSHMAFGHSLLRIDAGRWWYEALKDCNNEPVPKDFATFRGPGKDGEPRYGNTQITPYGEKLRCMRVSEILTQIEIKSSMSSRDKAALSYLAHLDPDSRVALYWH
jgi:hypothetical protein